MISKLCGKCGCRPCACCPPSESKPPIYPVELIEVACRALEAMSAVAEVGAIAEGSELERMGDEIGKTAIRIIRDGLASYEKAIKGGP